MYLKSIVIDSCLFVNFPHVKKFTGIHWILLKSMSKWNSIVIDLVYYWLNNINQNKLIAISRYATEIKLCIWENIYLSLSVNSWNANVVDMMFNTGKGLRWKQLTRNTRILTSWPVPLFPFFYRIEYSKLIPQ